MVERGRRQRVSIRGLGGLSSRRAGKDKDSRSAVEEIGMRRERHPIPMLPASRRDVLAIAAALLLVSRPARADPIGSVTKLPLPRFASLKTDRVNLREGPSKDHATKWVYQRAGLPVEITAEFEIWRKVRDFGRRRRLGPSFVAVGPANRAGDAKQEGGELQDLRAPVSVGRIGRDASGGSDRQHPQLRRFLVPNRRRRIQGVHRAGEIVGRVPERKDRIG